MYSSLVSVVPDEVAGGILHEVPAADSGHLVAWTCQ